MKASAFFLLSAVLGACCVLAAANEPVTWATANCDCSKERAIVCGADGTSYLNKCWAECSHTTVEHDGPCGKLAADVSASCECTKERALVCGADGHTYLNKCWAECVDTEVAYEGACQKVADVSANCECSKERALVCGADGHTYLNKCWAECVDTEVAYDGACKKDADANADVNAGCPCTKERALVCGDDGHTYLNECWARCSQADVVHQGPCSRPVEHPPCACTKERDLVCGADGHTYLNACWAACSGTSVSHDGACKKPVAEAALASECDLRCLDFKLFDYARPVCGADDETYPSECAAACAGAEPARPGTCRPCLIPPIVDPVCDTQGYTWKNPIELACAGKDFSHRGACEGFVPPPPVDDAVKSAESVAVADVSGECEDSCDKLHNFAYAACGDGKNYPSQCAAKCAGADPVRAGTCEPCPVPPIYAPVCDTQGYTWVNRYEMACAGAKEAHNFECDGFNPRMYDNEMLTSSECQKACPRVLAPVCGMNDKSYANACRMECDGVELKHEGRCAIRGPAEEAVSGDCEDSCSKRGYARAICAVIGDETEKTYPSECAAECAGADPVHRGTCKLCPVPLIYSPVCDTQGYTWSNRFELQCAGQEYAHDGECKGFFEVETDPAADDMVASSECQKACPRVLAPVCGMNNKSYANACRMECDGVELKHEGRCAIRQVV